LSTPVAVQVANGHKLQCTSQFPQAPWSIDGYIFHSDLKVLSLSSYDMILGFDWLESFSPMKVDWRHKWLSICDNPLRKIPYYRLRPIHFGH
jgi:hypothetical protein